MLRCRLGRNAIPQAIDEATPHVLRHLVLPDIVDRSVEGLFGHLASDNRDLGTHRLQCRNKRRNVGHDSVQTPDRPTRTEIPDR